MTNKEFDKWYTDFIVSFSQNANDNRDRKPAYKEVLGNLRYSQLDFVRKWLIMHKPGFPQEPGVVYSKYIEMVDEFNSKKRNEEKKQALDLIPRMTGERMKEIRQEMQKDGTISLFRKGGSVCSTEN